MIFLAGLFFSQNELKAQTLPLKPDEMCWWYDKPATKFWEGMPIATGRFAAMILGRISEEQIYLNEETIWSGGPNNPNNPEGPALIKEMQKLILNGEYLKADSISTRFNSKPMRVQHYQPMGNLNLNFENQDESKITDYRRKLSLDSALVTITYRLKEVNYKREIFASYLDQVIVMGFQTASPVGNGSPIGQG